MATKTPDQLAPGDVLITPAGDLVRITGEVRASRTNPGYHAAEVDLGVLLLASDEQVGVQVVDDRPTRPILVPEGPDSPVVAGMALPLTITEEVYGDALLVLDEEDLDVARAAGRPLTASGVLMALHEADDDAFDSRLADLVEPTKQAVSERSFELDTVAMRRQRT